MKLVVGEEVYATFPENDFQRIFQRFGMEQKMVFSVQHQPKFFNLVFLFAAIRSVVEDVIFGIAFQIVFGKGNIGDLTAIVPVMVSIEYPAPKRVVVNGGLRYGSMDL